MACLLLITANGIRMSTSYRQHKHTARGDGHAVTYIAFCSYSITDSKRTFRYAWTWPLG